MVGVRERLHEEPNLPVLLHNLSQIGLQVGYPVYDVIQGILRKLVRCDGNLEKIFLGVSESIV